MGGAVGDRRGYGGVGGAVVDGWEWQWEMGGAVGDGRGSREWEGQ